MIVSARPQAYDGSWRIVSLQVGDSGALEQTLAPLATHDEVHLSYIQQHKTTLRLKAEVIAGRASPLALHLELHRMSAAELATRTGLGKRTVARHLTPDGFGSATVDELRRYATVFDISIADFFVFIELPDGVEAAVTDHRAHLVQVVELRVTGGAPG